MRLRERLLQDFGDRVRQLHRALDLSFPEFTRYVRSLDSELATTILTHYPTAAALRTVSVKKLAGLRYDGRHRVGEELAHELLAPRPGSRLGAIRANHIGSGYATPAKTSSCCGADCIN